MINCAEIRNEQLYLEVFILDGKQISLSTLDSFTISEIGSPVSRSYSGNVSLQIIMNDEQMMWGFLNKAEVIQADSLEFYLDESIREKFIWQDDKLALRYEKLTFEDKYFNSLEAAENYASQTGYPKKSIIPIPMQNAGLQVLQNNSKAQFFQLPVRLSCSGTVSFNGQKNDYNGTFIIKQIKGKLSIGNLLDIDNYVAGVVPNEIGNLAPEEALKAQAVAARTHAVSMLLFNRHSNDGYDLCNGTHCQVYKGNYLRNEKIDKAVLDTKGVVMLYDGKIVDAVYHSNCGGKTESNQGAWNGKAIPYLQGVSCNQDLDSLDLSIEDNAVNWINTKVDTKDMASWEKRSEQWEQSISLSNIEKNTGVSNLHTLQVLKRGFSGRILKLRLIGSNEATIDGEYKIRQAFGGLPSSYFYVINGKHSSKSNYALSDKVVLKGRGYGHGVGLCQVGALQKARDGWAWNDLLEFYYPGITFTDKWLNTR